MNCVSDGKYVCGVGLAQVAVESHAHKRGKLVADPSFDPPDRASHPRTTHSGGIHGMAGAGWNYVLRHTDLSVRLRTVIEADMARFEQAGHPRPRIPRLVALHGIVRGTTNFIGGNSQISLFN
jgi:hypothetical protein